jgi:hypothetical protein
MWRPLATACGRAASAGEPSGAVTRSGSPNLLDAWGVSEHCHRDRSGGVACAVPSAYGRALAEFRLGTADATPLAV